MTATAFVLTEVFHLHNQRAHLQMISFKSSQYQHAVAVCLTSDMCWPTLILSKTFLAEAVMHVIASTHVTMKDVAWLLAFLHCHT